MFQRCSKYKNLIIVLLICVCMYWGINAFAEDLPNVSIACRPEKLIEPAEITLSITVNNDTGNDCANLYISTSDGLISEPIGSLSNGESMTFTRRHSVTEEELESELIRYIFTFDDPEDTERKVNFYAEASVLKAESRVDCEFTRRFSSESIPAGGTVTILYTARNTGNTALDSLRITDSLGDFTGRIENLAAGESRSLISRVTLTDAAISEAVLTYPTSDGERSIALAETEIGISSADLSLMFRAISSKEAVSSGTGTLTLNNNGSTKYSDITVTDDFSGEIIAENLSLDPGETCSVTHSFALRGTIDVRWRVIGYSSDGIMSDILTDTIRLSQPEPDKLSNVSFTAEAITPALKRSGNAVVRINITNSGDADVNDLHVTDLTGSEAASFLTLSPVGTITRDLRIPVTKDTDIAFNVDYVDADGWQYAVACEPVHIKIDASGVMPENASASLIDFSKGSIRIGGSSLFAILLIIGILLLITLTVILIVLSHRARIRKQVRLALKKQNKGRS